MFRYIIKRAYWEYKMFAYGYQLRRLSNRIIDMELKREKQMKKYEKFKKQTKKQRSTLARYIHN